MPSSSRSTIRARPSCRRDGGSSAAIDGASSSSRIGSTFVVSTLERLVERLEAISGRRLDRDALRATARDGEPAGRDFRRGTQADRVGAGNARADDRADQQRDGHAVGSRHRLGARARARISATRCAARRRRRSRPARRATRLMWVGAGLWHDTDFYTAFEESHGAVFVWSMYLAFGPDGYIRYGFDDPMAALASRTASFNEYLHNPPWAAEWIVAAGARASHRRGARAAPAEHEAVGDGPPVHRARARRGRHSGVADRSGRRRRARLGSRRDARGGAPFLDTAGAAMIATCRTTARPTGCCLSA